MYQDDSITLGLVHTDDAVRFSKQLPVVSVVAPLEHSPLAVVWDPTKHSFNSWKQIGDSGAKILVFTKAVNYVPFLIAKGHRARFVLRRQLRRQLFALRRGHVDRAAGVRDRDAVSPQERDLAVRARRRRDAREQVGLRPVPLERRRARRAGSTELGPCLARLVPIIQQAQVDYIKNPMPTHKVMVDVVTQMKSFWTLSMPLLEVRH